MVTIFFKSCKSIKKKKKFSDATLQPHNPWKKLTKKKMNSQLQTLEIRKLQKDENARFIRKAEVETIAAALARGGPDDKSQANPLIVHATPNPAFNAALPESETNQKEIFDLLNGHHRCEAAEKAGKPTWPCLVYRDLNVLEKSKLKINNDVQTPSSEAEKILLLHEAILDYVVSNEGDGLWINKNFIQKIKTSTLVDQLLPPAGEERQNDNWQNLYISCAAFGFRKLFTFPGPTKNKPDPKPKNCGDTSKVFTPVLMMTKWLSMELSDAEKVLETLDSIQDKQLLSKTVIDLFTKRHSYTLVQEQKAKDAKEKAATGTQINGFVNTLMRVRRLYRIRQIIAFLSGQLEELEEFSDSEATDEYDATVSRIQKYLDALKMAIGVTNVLCKNLDEDPPQFQPGILEFVVRMLVWTPLEFWSFFLGPLEEINLFSYCPAFAQRLFIVRYGATSTQGSVPYPGNVNLRNRIKAKILSPSKNTPAVTIAALMREYLEFVFSEKQEDISPGLENFKYFIYSKDFTGTLVNPNPYAGFEEEVIRTQLDAATPKNFGFVKSYSKLNW